MEPILTTDIKDIQFSSNDDDDIEVDITDANASAIVTDFSYSHQQRMKAFLKIPNENIEELVSKLSVMFRFSPISSLRNYLIDICYHTNIELVYKLDISYSLIVNDSSTDKGFEILEYCCGTDTFKTNVLNGSAKVNAIFTLYQCDIYKTKAVSYLQYFLTNKDNSELFRYKTLQSSQKIFTLNEWVDTCWVFITISTVRYTILTLQHMLNVDADRDNKIKCEDYLLAIAKNQLDENLDENARADACDVLIQMGYNYVNIAEKILLEELGGGRKNIYTNSQNVHAKEVETSAIEIIYKLTNTVKREQYTNEQLFEKWCVSLQDEYPMISKSLVRVQLDKTRFKNLPEFSLQQIFVLCCEYIEQSDYKDMLKERLVEELKEMQDTCSSGYITRLANVFSGFNGMQVRISWEDAIITKFSLILNKYIEQSVNCDDILESMLETRYENKLVFLRFFRDHVAKLREDLWHEFKNDIDDVDFDLYFKKALTNYEL